MNRESELLIDMWDTLHRECHKVVTEENYDVIKKAIKALEQEPRKGHWIKETMPIPLSDAGKECVRCSECNLHYDVESVYCPNCGSLMMKED
jgi:hypothetical protein